MVQNPGFSCPESSSFSTDFFDKASQDFLVEELVNSLLLRNKLMMHQSVMVKEGDQHHFHLRTANVACGPCLVWVWTHFSIADFVVLFLDHIERPTTRLLWWRFPRVCRLLPAAEGCLGMHSIVELSAPQSIALAPFWHTLSACPKCPPKWFGPFLCPSQLRWQIRKWLSDGHCEPTAEPFQCWHQSWKCKAYLTLNHPPHLSCLPQIARAIQKLLFWTWKNLHKHYVTSSKFLLQFFLGWHKI